MTKIMIVFLFLNLIATNTNADTWARLEKKEFIHTYEFGKVKILLKVDARENQHYPSYEINIYKDKKLKGKYVGISFDSIYASKDNSIFVGFSNSGLPGTAVVIFDDDGYLLKEVKHRDMIETYCDESVTLTRKWVSEKADVKFIYEKRGRNKYISYISYLNCSGERKTMEFVNGNYRMRKIMALDAMYKE